MSTTCTEGTRVSRGNIERRWRRFRHRPLCTCSAGEAQRCQSCVFMRYYRSKCRVGTTLSGLDLIALGIFLNSVLAKASQPLAVPIRSCCDWLAEHNRLGPRLRISRTAHVRTLTKEYPIVILPTDSSAKTLWEAAWFMLVRQHWLLNWSKPVAGLTV